MREEFERTSQPEHNHGACPASLPRTRGRGGYRLRSCAVIVAAAAVSSFPAAAANGKPCAEHEGAAKKACAKQLKRDAMAYPPKPRWSEAMKRMTSYEQATLLRIGRCEMGEQANDVKAWGKHGPAAGPWSRLRWGLNLPRYSTAFGIWNGNGHYIRSETSYSFPGATPAEEVLGAMALARGPARGFSGWGCF